MFKILHKWSFIIIAVFSIQVQANVKNSDIDLIQQIQSITEEAYIFAYPMLQNYKSLYSRTVLGKKPINVFSHRQKLLGPKFTAIVGPNNDTLYSASWLDLSGGPLVISVPEVEKSRYYSIQLIDMYTHNFAYIGQRSTGSKAGSYVIVGPNHDLGDLASKYSGVFQSETNFVFAIGRMLAKGSEDEKVAANLLKQYQLYPLTPLSDKNISKLSEELPPYSLDIVQSYKFIELFNYLLSHVSIHPSEDKLVSSFSKIGIGAGKTFDMASYSPEVQAAIKAGVKSALSKISAESKLIGAQVAGWNTTYLGFGSRNVMQGKYLLRAAAAMIALYGNDREENSSFSRQVDQKRQPLDGSLNDNSSVYTLRFEKGHFPQSDAFWSLTMYRLPEVLLYENEIQRYSIGDRTKNLNYAEDGSLTFYIQHKAPEGDKLKNWLPAPAGPFALALRTYLPKPAVYLGEWLPPEVKRVR